MENKTPVTQDKRTLLPIEEWKRKYGDILQYTAEDGREAYFRYPNRKEVGYSAALIEKNPVGSAEALLRACFLGGDRAIIEEDEYFFGLQEWSGLLIKKKSGTLQIVSTNGKPTASMKTHGSGI